MDPILRQIHEALFDLIRVANAPQPDAMLIQEAGITIDRALLPLLARIRKFGRLGVVELAEMVGRDYTTVSRQVAKLESLGLVERRPSATDKRVREASVTAAGEAMNVALDGARDRLFNAHFSHWPAPEKQELARLLRKFADEALQWTR
jgi:DNA-binding MarR family transcriptional regulator